MKKVLFAAALMLLAACNPQQNVRDSNEFAEWLKADQEWMKAQQEWLEKEQELSNMQQEEHNTSSQTNSQP
jgi:predicted metal-dependent hydrolase